MGHETDGTARAPVDKALGDAALLPRHGKALVKALCVAISATVLGTFADTHPYGAVRFDCDVTVDGVAVAANTPVYATTWPTQMCVRPVVPADKTFFRFESDAVEGVSSCPTYFYLQMDGSFYVVPPAFGDTVRDFRHVYAARTIWVDADAEDGDTTGDGTEENPYHTLQYAVDQVPDIEPTIVYAKPGDYDEGGSSLYNASNRVTIVQYRTILLKAVEGPAVTAIVGEEDTTSYPEQQSYCPKMGPLAKRCVAIDKNGNGSCIQGFTLRDGHASTAYESDGTTPVSLWGDARTQGGAVYSNGGYVNQIVDCVVSNCTAGKSTLGGMTLRTRACKCHNASSFHEQGWMVSCSVVDITGAGRMGGYASHPNGGGQDTIAGGSPLMLCTVTKVGSWSCGTYWNGAYDNSRWIPNAKDRYFGSIFVAGNTDACGGSGIYYTKTNEQFFCDVERDDVRLLKSEIVEGVPQPTVGTTAWYVWATNFAAVATTDVNGERLRFIANGGPLPGAYQETAQAFVLTPKTCGFDVTSPSGGMCGTAGETITFSPNTNGTRYAEGVVVNGVTNLFANLTGGAYSYTVPDSFDSGSVPVTVLVSPYWYADAVNGKDTNKGFTPESAFRTPCYAMRKMTAGETLRLLPGIYNEGVTDRWGNTTPSSPPCRVDLRAGCTIESMDGPEKTVIMGSPAPGPDADELGRGTNAVACILMHQTGDTPTKAVAIRGLTLTGGRTRTGSDGTSRPFENEYYCNSAIGNLWNDNSDYVTIENCIITNNACNAYTGCGGNYINCVFDDNPVEYGTGVARGIRLNNCLISSGVATEVSECRNTTFGKSATLDLLDGYPAVNCVIGGALGWGSYYYGRAFTNCLFAVNYAKCARVDCVVTNYEAIGIDDRGVPTNKTALVVDAADPKWIPEDIGETDALGNPRILNGAMDIGGVEYDWRKEYAKDISKHGHFAVTNATTNVVEGAANTVVIADGQSLTGVWTDGEIQSKARVKVRVVGAGTFTVTVGGETVATLAGPTAAPVFVTFPTDAALVDATLLSRQNVTFSFSGTGYAEIFKTGIVRGLVFTVR